MFSSKTQKLLALQNDYIERINKNAVKLDNQLNFLMEIQNHIGEQLGGGFGATTPTNRIPTTASEKKKSSGSPRNKSNTNTPIVKTVEDKVGTPDVVQEKDGNIKNNTPKATSDNKVTEVPVPVQENKTGSFSDTTDFQKMEVYNKISEGMIEAQRAQSENLTKSLEGLTTAMSKMKEESATRAKNMAQLLEQSKETSKNVSRKELSVEQNKILVDKIKELQDGTITYDALIKDLIDNKNEGEGKVIKSQKDV